MLYVPQSHVGEVRVKVFNATYNNISKDIEVTRKCACGGWGGKGGGCGLGQGLGVDRKVCVRGWGWVKV